MTHKIEGIELGTPTTYRIRVQGYLDERYSDRTGGMNITPPGDEDEPPVTTLNGRLLDQAAKEKMRRSPGVQDESREELEDATGQLAEASQYRIAEGETP